MEDKIKYEYKEITLAGSMTEKGRKRILDKQVQKMAKKGWELDSYHDGSLTKKSTAIFNRPLQVTVGSPTKKKSVVWVILKWSIGIFIGFWVLGVIITVSQTPEEKSQIAKEELEKKIREEKQETKNKKLKNEQKVQEEKQRSIRQKQEAKQKKIELEKKNTDAVEDPESSRKEMVSITSKNIKRVIKSLKKNYNINATAYDNEKLDKFKMCWNDRACEIYADKVQIQGTYKTVEALTSSRVSPQYYQKVCSAIMIALTGANKELIEQQIPQYFNYASQNGRSRWEVLGIEITISPDSSGLLGCSFYKK